MISFSFWEVLRGLLTGLRWTLGLSAIAFVLGGVLACLLLPLRVGPWRLARTLCRAYIELFQGTPLLMQMFLAFFGLPLIGIDVSPLLAASTSLALWSAAFLTEIWRAAVEAVPRAQWEASSALAMSYGQQMRYVVLPQAFRLSLAPSVGFLVQAVKGTALASVIGFMELSKTASAIANATFDPFLAYGLAAVLYFLICWPLSRFARHIERRHDAARPS